MKNMLSALELKKMIRDGHELAIFDVREQGDFGKRHLLFSTCLPLSRLELHIRELAPRTGVPIVLVDDDGRLAERAREKLVLFGYTDVSILDGGVQSWAEAGYEIFSGISVPSKAFGEFVERDCKTPSITPQELHNKLSAGENVVILDSRPHDEFVRMAIPGGVNVPGAELAYRAHVAAPDPNTEIVVNCAGRTRSIIGAQSLINAGIPNPVYALRNGTMGWHLAGLALETGATRRPPELSPGDIERARDVADAVATRFGVKSIDRAQLELWRRESDERSLYLLDVRSAEEYRAGHLPGSIHTPGGQLVQNTNSYIGVLNARVVLIDDTRLRATMTASWLLQMGWRDVAVLVDGLNPDDLVSGSYIAEVPNLAACDAERVSPDELRQLSASHDVTLVDVSLSPAYRSGHIPGAWFCTRAKLATWLETAPLGDMLVIVSEDGRLAGLAAAEINPDCRVCFLEGGMAAWRERGFAESTGFENMAHSPNDYYERAFEREDDLELSMRNYLTWEVGLIDQIERDGDARFDIVRVDNS